MNIIELKDISKTYVIEAEGEVQRVEALKNINLNIEEGEFVAIIGPSGSGKSTLMQIMGLLDSPTEGRYNLLGKDISSYSEDELSTLRRETIGFVFQFFNLMSRTSCVDNVNLPLIYAGRSDLKKSQAFLSKVGLSDRSDHEPSQLSGGQQQRVAIARALINEPSIIFADEPTGNINSKQSQEVMDYFKKLNSDGVTIVLVTHDPHVASVAKRIITIEDGSIKSDIINKEYIPLSSESSSSSSFYIPNIKLKKSAIEESKNYTKNLDLNFIKENLKMAYTSLFSNKFRTFLSALGITIGIASVIAMISIGNGAKKSIQEDLASMGTNVINVRRAYGRRGGRGQNKSSRITMNDVKTIQRLQQQGVPIASISPTIQGRSQMVVFGNKNFKPDTLIAVSSDYFRINSLKITRGKVFTDEEDERRERVCVIGTSVYKSLFSSGVSPIGSQIKIGNSVFKVIGLLEQRGSDGMRDADSIIVIPLNTGMYRLMGSSYLSSIIVEATSSDDSYVVQQEVEQALRQSRKIPPDSKMPISVNNNAEFKQMMDSTTTTMSILLGCIAFISLIVGGVNVMNIMLVSLKERIKEIGLKKAIGARSFDILFQFALEAALIGGIGGVCGVILGILVCLISSLIGWYAPISTGVSIIALVFSFLVAFIFGYWPARQAARLSPIEALRSE